jgi:hypothetical protein
VPGRGRLLWWFWCGIYRLDTEGTEAAGGYDNRFRTVKTSYPRGPDKPRERGRVELPEVRLKAQTEIFDGDRQQQGPAGNVPQSKLVLVFHMKQLEQLGLVDEDGQPLIHVGDRLDAIYTKTGKLVRRYTNPQMFATEVPQHAFGLGFDQNLLNVVFDDRPQGLPQAPG